LVLLSKNVLKCQKNRLKTRFLIKNGNIGQKISSKITLSKYKFRPKHSKTGAFFMPKFKERVSIHVGDLRTLCRQCRSDYLVAGYKTLKTNNEMIGSCDKCGRPGFDYIIIKKEGEKKNVRAENTGRR
jgi:hypothetical protein